MASPTPKKQIELYSYVQVIDVPGPWEGSGEDLEDREAYVGHIGIVVEVARDVDDFYLVRFPSHKEEASCQRNIEKRCLRLVSVPMAHLTDLCLES